jgi:hypothetical protein
VIGTGNPTETRSLDSGDKRLVAAHLGLVVGAVHDEHRYVDG